MTETNCCLMVAVLVASVGLGLAQNNGQLAYNLANLSFGSGVVQATVTPNQISGFTIPTVDDGQGLSELENYGFVFGQTSGGAFTIENRTGQMITVIPTSPYANVNEFVGTLTVGDFASFVADVQTNVLNGATDGDPIVTGFDGSRFEFAGVAGQAYSFLSTTDHSLNVAMVPANLSQKQDGGTFIGSAGLVYKGHTIQASVDKPGNMTVLVDDAVISQDTLETSPNHATEFDFGDDDTVVVELFRAGFGLSVRMETPLMVASFYVTPPGLDAYYGQVVRGYLNLALQLKPTADLSQMHGVLGQTVHAKAAKPAGAAATATNTITAFHGEGEEADYLVSSLTASDSKFNTFGKPPIKLRLPRHLLASGQATVPLRVASVAPSMLANAAATME